MKTNQLPNVPGDVHLNSLTVAKPKSTFFSEKIRDLQKSDDDGQLNVFVFLAFDAVLLAEKKKLRFWQEQQQVVFGLLGFESPWGHDHDI